MKKTVAVLICLAWLLICARAYMKIANDPTRLRLGARVLGIGSSFVGLADDTTAIFLNPAGLAQDREWQLSSMSGKFLNIYNYSQFSALFPTGFGTFGVGYGGSLLEFHVPSYEVIVIGDQTRYIASGEVSGKYSNTAMLFAYANQAGIRFLPNKLNLGGSLKLLSQDLSAAGLGAGTAAGMELNVGALYPVSDDLKLGLSVLNALPAGMGGKIKWSTGLEENFPAILKAGVAYRFPLLQQLTAAADYDRYLTRDLPGRIHAGVEWYPLAAVAVRAGLEQNYTNDTAGATTLSNDLTYGLGLNLRGFRFDYAYHNYNDLSANATNYFSLSYSPPPGPTMEAVKELIRITAPPDWGVVHEEKVALQGLVLDPIVKQVLVQGKVVVLHGPVFSAEAQVAAGRNAILVEAYNGKGKIVKELRHNLVRLLSFKDVAADYWARLPIEQLATLGIIAGYPDGTFRPEGSVTRAELCSLLMKTRSASDEARSRAALKVVTGYFNGTFQPNRLINRAEAVTVIARFAALPPARPNEAPYTDVPGRYWAVGSVLAAKEAGLLDFIKNGYFFPNDNASRSEIAYMLAKTSSVEASIKWLMGEVKQ